MKIAIMMRAIDTQAGYRPYTEGVVRTLLQIDQENEYLLLYRKPDLLGLFSGHKNVKEMLIGPSHVLLWDQVAVPLAARRERADIIWNPKFSVPLLSHCPVTMVLQEPAWFAIPEHHAWWDVLYMRAMLPLYCRKASHLFPQSEFNLNETRKYLRLPLENVTVTHYAPDACFMRVWDAEALRQFRQSHGLPEKFILTVTRVLNQGNNSATFTGTKNLETTLHAFQQIREHVPHKLVIKGQLVREYLEYKGWKDLEGVHFVSQFLPREEVPKLYQAADLCVLPSFYEGCPTTLIEAMASGCPIVASKSSAFPEISAGAALLSDPHDPSDFAEKMLRALTDKALRDGLRQKSLQRAKFFNWERTARLTLQGFEEAVGGTRRVTNLAKSDKIL